MKKKSLILLCFVFFAVFNAKKMEAQLASKKMAAKLEYKRQPQPAPAIAPSAKTSHTKEASVLNNLAASREAFLSNENFTASSDLVQAAAKMRQEAEKSAADAKKKLIASSEELDKLAEGVRTEKIKDGKKFDAILARAHYALAKNHYLMAREAWAKKDSHQASKDLEDTASNIEKSIALAGQQGAEAGTKALTLALTISNKLQEATGATEAEVNKGLADLDRELEKLGKALGLGAALPAAPVGQQAGEKP